MSSQKRKQTSSSSSSSPPVFRKKRCFHAQPLITDYFRVCHTEQKTTKLWFEYQLLHLQLQDNQEKEEDKESECQLQQ